MSPQQTKGSEKSNISSLEFASEAEGFSSTPRPMGRAFCKESLYLAQHERFLCSGFSFFDQLREKDSFTEIDHFLILNIQNKQESLYFFCSLCVTVLF